MSLTFLSSSLFIPFSLSPCFFHMCSIVHLLLCVCLCFVFRTRQPSFLVMSGSNAFNEINTFDFALAAMSSLFSVKSMGTSYVCMRFVSCFCVVCVCVWTAWNWSWKQRKVYVLWKQLCRLKWSFLCAMATSDAVGCNHWYTVSMTTATPAVSMTTVNDFCCGFLYVWKRTG